MSQERLNGLATLAIEKEMIGNIDVDALPVSYQSPNTQGNPEISGAGGIFRDETGSWGLGLTAHLGICTSVASELHAVRLGLSIAWDCGYRAIECEVDARIVLQLIENGDVALHPLGAIIEDIENWALFQTCLP
ncbi:hypothetical protein F3Y22_tig00110343pilonHSYRG00030 [Hibiscus syriacus]|uniref:RNase H type-1 domain-containing protein n=1 Tax=Hibiscus syriacus TaxID=106335 RepID=A0A6A3B001_HIBSY|nr:hypothetical protein F3Y22_tig00110343pilonHSYRG00030 [Hibiscus syriacus]